jgi:NAD(P)-dependent dehydrogenase (short-subunit alcohol dehydrogenase family)
MDLEGRTAVLVGGGSGVGRGVAVGLAAAGMRVAVGDIDAASAERVADELRANGATAIGARVDATDTESLAAFAERASAELAGVHVLVNTVGVILDRALDEATEADWSWFFEFNIMATVRSVNTFLPHLRAHGEPAHIVVTSSMAGLLALGPELVGGVRNGLYTTTKHALIGYSEMLRQELAPEGIGVSVLCPGLVQGSLSATSARNRPARFGGPLPTPERVGMPSSAMPSEGVGPVVAAAIRANRFGVFTHPEVLPLVQARHDRLVDDLRFAAEGDAGC